MEEIDYNIFTKKTEEYTRDIAPVEEYIKQTSTLVSRKLNIPLDDAIKKVKKIINSKDIKNPFVTYNYRDDNGDVTSQKEKLSDYIKDAVNNNEVMVPSFTTYLHPDTKKSLHGEFMKYNADRRSKFKKEAFKCKQAGDMDNFNLNNVMQKTMKIANNSLSGAYASKGTILYNPSAHYTLTSITRCVSSVGNALSESLIAGNKHFKDPQSVLNYIAAVISNIDMKQVRLCIDKYSLYIPLPEQIFEEFKNCWKWYWDNPDYDKLILDTLLSLTEEDRVALMYVNDLWHMKMFNEPFVRQMVTNLKELKTGITDDATILTRAPEGIDILVKIICSEHIKNDNRSLTDLKGNPLGDLIGSTCANVIQYMKYYKLLFRTFFCTNIMPIDIAYIKEMFRDVIVLSDTDSTCATYERWVEWYTGEPKVNHLGISVTAVIMTITSLVIDHYLKVLSRNINVSKDRMDLLKMKNEFFWPVFTTANKNKHYFASTSIQEGNFYREPELEMKGVHIIASAADGDITGKVHDMIKDINNKLSNNEKLSLNHYCSLVANLEREVIRRIKDGDVSIFKKDKIKDAKSYKQEAELSPYINHILWQTVYAEKYGDAPPPAYTVIKVPTILDTKTKMNVYLENLKDQDISSKLKEFLVKYKKDTLMTLRPPVAIVSDKGLPEEYLEIIDYNRVINDNLNSAYIILESIGYYKKGNVLLSQEGF